MSYWYNHKLKNLPEWFWTAYANDTLQKLSGGNIANVLRHQPQLHPLFDLNKLSGWDIAWVLKYQPQLHPLFDLNKLYGWDIRWILASQPQLQNLFEDINV